MLFRSTSFSTTARLSGVEGTTTFSRRICTICRRQSALWTIEDVTQRVKDAAAKDMSAADANTARRKMMTTIEAEAEKKTGLDCQVVTLWQGGQYHLYGYKRYTDIRLVMAPEEEIAFFGGDNDNFEYPRFDLDMCFFRDRKSVV